jgi:glycosyltransferase involved in cell wall biosynthesis
MKIIQYMLGIRNADGGVVRAFVDLCLLMAARGHEVICLTADDRDAARDWDGRNGRPKLVALKASRTLPMFFDRAAMKQFHAMLEGADAVHLHVPWDPICAQLARSCRRRNTPYILSLHGMLDDWTVAKGSLKKRVYLSIAGRAMLEHAAFVHCTAEIEKQQSSKWYPQGKTVIAPLPFDLAPFTNLPGPESACETFGSVLGGNRPTWLFVGRLHPIKRIELMVEACSQMKNQGTRCRMLIAGSGENDYENRLRSIVKQGNLIDDVHFLGFITGQQKISLYQAVDGVILPSAHESFGYSAIEALACGKPLITTDAVNIWQDLQSSGGAVIVEPTADAIAKAMTALQSDLNRRAEMGRQGREWVFRTLEPNLVAEVYESLYAHASRS